MSNYHSHKVKTVKLLLYHCLCGGHIPQRKIEPPFLAARLRKMQSDQDHHLAAFPLKYSNFICHEVSNIPHQTSVASTSLENIDWLAASKKCELSIQRQKMSIVSVYLLIQ